MRLAASRTFWTAGSSRPIRIAIIAITTSSSISVNARRDGDTGRGSFRRMPGGVGPGGRADGLAHAREIPVPAARPVPGRRTRLDGQVFRLSARLDARTPSRGRPQWPRVRGLADYGGGP